MRVLHVFQIFPTQVLTGANATRWHTLLQRARCSRTQIVWFKVHSIEVCVSPVQRGSKDRALRHSSELAVAVTRAWSFWRCRCCRCRLLRLPGRPPSSSWWSAAASTTTAKMEPRGRDFAAPEMWVVASFQFKILTLSSQFCGFTSPQSTFLLPLSVSIFAPTGTGRDLSW